MSYRIFGISGKAGAGKTEFAKKALLMYGGTRISLAAAVKQEVAAVLDGLGIAFSWSNLYGTQQDREELVDIPSGRCVALRVVGGTVFTWGRGDGLTFRKLLQVWGTDYRRAQDPQYWVNKVRQQIKDTEGLIFVDDIRFPDEAKMILNMCGALIRVDRPGGPRINSPWHESETALDNWDQWTLHLDNDPPDDLDHYHDLIDRSMRFLV